MKTEKFGRIPKGANGSSSTYEADVLHYVNSNICYALVGGNRTDEQRCGPFAANINRESSYSTNTIGSGLSCKPLAMA